MKTILIFFFFIYTATAFAQPANDECSNPIQLPSSKEFCSTDGQYTTVGATPSFVNSGNDVWFTFTPRDAYDLYITVYGAGNGGTLQSPVIKMFPDCGSNAGLTGSSNSTNNVTTFYIGGLKIGTNYYISVSGSNTGTFKLCYQNQNAIIKPGQDCNTAKFLCSTETVRETNISGAGNNPNEGAGTCMQNASGVNSETNSAWFKWTAANNGTLAFTIIPTVITDDLDWALFDLGTTDNCTKTVIRCADGSGVTCGNPGTPGYYYKTGLDFNSTDVNEAVGCGQGQDGKVKYVDMIKDHIYALLINNPYSRGNGFIIDFKDQNGKAGTGEFVGPKAVLDLQKNNPCTNSQSFTFKSLSTGATSLKWDFGEDASVSTATGPEPYTVSYSTPGIKTAVLEAHGDNTCYTIDTKTFAVGLTPAPPVLTINQTQFCLGNTISIAADSVKNGTYLWTGPNGFTSTKRIITFPADNYNKAGTYSVTVTVFECASNASSITVPPIGQTPVTAFTITGNQVCTKQQNYTFTNKTTDYQKLRWDFGSGASLATSTNEGPFNITYATPGTKTIVLEAEGSTGCSVSKTMTLEVSPVPDIPVAQINKQTFCLTDTIKLTSPLLANTSYLWTGPNNFSASTNNVDIIVNNKAVGGVYSLKITQGSCTSEATVITVPAIRGNPIAGFRAEPIIPSKLSLPVIVDFFNESKNADTYLWDFGDGTTSTETNPSHEYTDIGEYNVTLTAFLSDVCFASVTKGKFVIRLDNSLFIPNTFTPNGDNVNDEFIINITNLKSYRIKIFNRYGTQLFTTTDIFINWNGTYQNEPVPVGTYFYIIDALGISNNEIKRSGSITVLR